MKFLYCIGLAPIALTACGPKHQPQEPTHNATSPLVPAPSAPPAVSDRSKLAQARLNPTIDPKSSEAAVALVKAFVDLVNQGRLNEAYMLLGPNAPPRADFDNDFSRYSDLRVEIGIAGDQEGAAGSIYLSVPLTLSGLLNGEHTNRTATAIVRRVNDVPGSTEAQRHWHIERIDMSG